MSMKKKLIAAVIAVVVLAGVGIFWKISSDAQEGAKQITIKIITKDDEKTYDLHTDTLTLAELLKEKEELNVVMEDGPYGAFITSMDGKKQNMEKGPWWIYSSKNNKDCKKQGMCPAVDAVHIQDQDAFEFSLTSDIN